MRLLLLKLGLFFVICITIVSFVLLKYGGYVDFFYEKFTTPKAKSLIIGDSRSFQGVQPSVINNYFDNREYEFPILNYSFTIAQALIGPYYNRSIFKKLDETSKNGLFIICLTPEMLATKKGYDNTKGEFREKGQPPHNLKFVSMNPNYEYFIKNLSFFHFKGAFGKHSKLHKDGWLEETNLPSDIETLNSWKKANIDDFLKDISDYKLSKIRIESLKLLVKKLKTHGEVFLVRMPISDEFLSQENKYYPKFDFILDSISKTTDIKYLNFNKMANKYETYDGHHINKFSGKIFTKDLCDLISINKK